MSNKIFKYNQSGVASSIQLGKKGGQVQWSTGTGRFEFTNSAGTNAVYVLPLQASDYSAVTKFEDNTLVTAGYVRSLIQGMRTKKAVQSMAGGNVPKDYFNPAASTILWDTVNPATPAIAIQILADSSFRTLFGFNKDFKVTNAASESDPGYVAVRKICTAGTRILLRNQDKRWQNGIYVFTLDNEKNPTRLYLKRDTDMDVQDEAEGAYVYVEQGDFEATGWVGNIPGSPETILDPTAPPLKNITASPDNYATADDVATGYTPITFEQFHGQGTIKGSAVRGISIDGNEVGLYYDGVPQATTANQSAITGNGEIVVQITDNSKKSYVRRDLKGLLTGDFKLYSYKIRDARGSPTDEAFEVRVAGGDGATGSAIEFAVPVTTAGYIAKDTLLSASSDHFTVDFGGREELGAIGTAAKGANIKFVAGGTESATGAGGDVILQAGNARTTNAGAHGGNIILSAGKSGAELDGIVRIEAAALCLPVGKTSEQPYVSDSRGAIRLNTELATGVDTLEYYNNKEWVQIDGASYFIHDRPDSGASTFDTFISTMGTKIESNGKVSGTDGTNTLTFVAHGKQVMSAKEDEVSITPVGSVKIIPVGNGKPADVIVLTPTTGAGSGAVGSTGQVSIKTGSNVVSATDGSRSGIIEIASGDHQYNSGDVLVSTGSVKGAGSSIASAKVGDLYLSTGENAVLPNDAASMGTVYVGRPKTGHFKNNVVVGDNGYTAELKLRGNKVTVGEDQTTTKIEIGKRNTSVANSTGDLVMYGKNVTIQGDDTVDVTNNNGVSITGRNIKVGNANTTTNVIVGHLGDNANAIKGSVVETRGSSVTVIADEAMKFQAPTAGTNIVFETKTQGTGGVLVVSDANYAKACTALNAIPNVEYVQGIVKDGQFGPGTRLGQVTKTTAEANKRVFQIGATALPAGARVTRVSLTVGDNFAWASAPVGGVGVDIKAATDATEALTGGTTLMSSFESDIEAPLGASATQTYMSEFGAGVVIGNKPLYIVFPATYTPESATKGDISVLVEFVGMPPETV